MSESLAILPFLNVDQDPDLEYLSNGIPDGLISALSHLPRLRVVTRSAAFSFRNRPQDMGSIRRYLRVHAALLGRIARTNKTINVRTFLVDVGSDEQITALGAALDREFGGLDFFVHGAAFAPSDALDKPFVETSRESFRIALDVSAYSLVGLTRAVAPLMARRGGGSVLTLTYIGSQRVFPNYNVMGVAKSALESSVRYLAAELGPQNIRVNAISAGAIRTLASAGISGFLGILQVYRDRAPLRRGVDQSEVADAALFLLGDAARAVTGEILMVDAGFHAVGL